MSDCIFCKIAAGEIPSATIYEDDDFRVILDMGPATRGHALILPKKHFADVAGMCRFQSGSEQRDCGWSDGVPFSCACDSEI